MDQTFNGPVDQVAAGDINNYGPVTWDQLTTKELHRQRKRNRSLLWAARRRLIFNLPSLIFVIGMGGAAIYVVYLLSQMGAGHFGTTANQVPPWVMFSYTIFGLGLPLHFVLRVRKREEAVIFDCQVRLTCIEVELNRRR